MREITMEQVIKGLKYLAEHQTAECHEIAKGLHELGCDYTFEDYEAQFSKEKEEKLFEGIRNGKLAAGASIIANVQDSVDMDFAWRYCKEKMLSVDDDHSIYSFIRLATGDESYTKKSLEVAS
jgi:hypothetical protein